MLNPTKTWQERFDERFPTIKVGEHMGGKLYADKELMHAINIEYFQDFPSFYRYNEKGEVISSESIKNFISDLRKKDMEALIEKFNFTHDSFASEREEIIRNYYEN